MLHVIDSLRTGGAEALLAALVGELSRQRLARSVVVAASLDADAQLLASLRSAADPVALIDVRSIADPRLLRALLGAIRTDGIDVVHSHLSTANVSARAAARIARIPQLTTVHTLPGPGAEDTRAHAALDGWTSHLSARLVAPSDEIAAGVRARYRVAARRVTVIPNAPAARPAAPSFDRSAMRAALLDGASGPLVACVARLQADKGIDDLIAASSLAGERLAGLRVVVAGDGPQSGRLRELAARSGDRVRLLGRRSDIGELLAASDAFCLPSHHEGVPLSMLEAMQAGIPCVVTAVGGIPDVVADRGTAFLAPPRRPDALAAALVEALTDSEAATRIAQAGARLVEDRYSLASVARRYAELYRELLSA